MPDAISPTNLRDATEAVQFAPHAFDAALSADAVNYLTKYVTCALLRLTAAIMFAVSLTNLLAEPS